MSFNLGAVPFKEVGGLVTDQCQVNLGTFRAPLLHIIEGSLEQVDVQTTTQATLGGDDDVTHSLDLTFDEVGVLVFQVPLSDMADHLAHGFSVRTAGRHAFLRTAHFACCHHFHSAGDLLSVFHTPDLVTYLFCAGHLLLSIKWQLTLPHTLTRSGLL